MLLSDVPRRVVTRQGPRLVENAYHQTIGLDRVPDAALPSQGPVTHVAALCSQLSLHLLLLEIVRVRRHASLIAHDARHEARFVGGRLPEGDAEGADRDAEWVVGMLQQPNLVRVPHTRDVGSTCTVPTGEGGGRDGPRVFFGAAESVDAQEILACRRHGLYESQLIAKRLLTIVFDAAGSIII